ncbi:MAG TPA: hypothetical protein VHR44_06130, partial [Beijerinckiaceae bacterium]|nr:hypothetical protein [Beijerinckiaceae bacterium]
RGNIIGRKLVGGDRWPRTVSMRHIFSEWLRREARIAAASRRRLRQDEPPIKHPERLDYLLKLLQEELRGGR